MAIKEKERVIMVDATAKGIAAEKIVEADLILKGVQTSTPSLGTSEFDILAFYGEQIYKIQVKSSYSENDRLRIEVRRPSARNRVYEEGSYDILAAVDLHTKKVAYLCQEDIVSTRQITLFLQDTVTPQGKTPQYKPIFFNKHINFEDAIKRIQISGEIGNRPITESA